MSIICWLPAVHPVLSPTPLLLPFEPASLGSGTVWPCHFTSWKPWKCSSLILWVRFAHFLHVLKKVKLCSVCWKTDFQENLSDNLQRSVSAGRKKNPKLSEASIGFVKHFSDLLLKTSSAMWANAAGEAEQQEPGEDKQTLVHLVLHPTQMCLDSLTYPIERNGLAYLERLLITCLTSCTQIIRRK